MSPLGLIERGWFIFPLAGRTKFPMKNFSWDRESTNDPEKIKKWLKAFPDSNWGVDCGKSKLAVLDEDNKDGKKGADTLFELELDFGELPKLDLYITETPGFGKFQNGPGKHYYFKGVCAQGTDKLGNGLDIKSQGGYVLAPGCRINGVEYKEIQIPKNGNSTQELLPWISELAGKLREKSEK